MSQPAHEAPPLGRALDELGHERTLRHGPLSFRAWEKGEGPLVLCLHGFPDHARSFRFQLPALAAQGYRVLAPTMRGYEPSSQPADGDYQLLSLARDVLAWLDQLGAPECHLIGHDWGAVVGYVVAALAPERICSLTTIAVPHPGRIMRELLRKRPSQLARSWYMFFFQLPGIAEYALERDDFALLDFLWRSWSPSYELPEHERRALKQTFAQPGVKQAALAYYRALPRQGSPSARQTRKLLWRPIQVRTLALTGTEDGCMDTRLYEDLMHAADFPAGLETVRLQDAGHFLHLEQPQQVNQLLPDWLRG
ncbi:MAG: Epoxide hydrolase [Myxococcaceae bacterium]|nr:Epoxide hydrolase [Myxococcaceae bacterium]